MSKISDELRDWCDRNDENGCGGFVTEYSFEDICDLADRIDRELVELPRDADGAPIHVGDVMWQKDRITKRTCKAIMGDVYVMLDGIQGAVYAKGLTHYHEPTVEDVLREFAYGLGVPVADSYVAAAATKLRLVEGVDE